MRVQFSSTLLTPSTLENAFNIQVNGQQVVDEASFIRAAAGSFFGRGNKGTTFSFSVTRLFSRRLDASLFLLGHLGSLPGQADLTLTIGDSDDAATVLLADAVLDSIQFSQRGLAVTAAYSFRGGLFATEEAPETTSDLMKVQVVDLTSGTAEQAVVFDTPFASAPRGIFPTLIPPAGGAVFGIFPRKSTIAADGLTFDFDAKVPATGYQISLLTVL